MLTLPKRVLIVEDEAITQRYLKEILLSHGIEEVVCFSRAKEVLEAMKKERYDVILMDINIDGSMDGIQLSRKILESYTLPILFISAYSDDETLEDVLELSPYGFITKPFGSKEVMTSLKVSYKRFLTFEAKERREGDGAYVVISSHYGYHKKRKILFENHQPVTLNTKQTKLLALLVKHLNNTISFEALQAYVWEDEEIASSALRTLVYTLRKRFPKLPLKTYSKEGYALVSEPIFDNF